MTTIGYSRGSVRTWLLHRYLQLVGRLLNAQLGRFFSPGLIAVDERESGAQRGEAGGYRAADPGTGPGDEHIFADETAELSSHGVGTTETTEIAK